MTMKVDFLHAQYDRAARRTTATVVVVFTVFVGVLASIGAGASYRSAYRGTSVLGEIGNLPVIADIRKLVLGTQASTGDPSATPDGRINVILFGVGGASHSGSQLTDSILLASVDTETDRIGLLSIPRDLAYPLGGARFQKINAVNAYAEQEFPGEGAQVAAKSIGKLLGLRMDHVMKIDFQGFVKFVDALDGIDVTVERGFADAQYPTLDDKWQTVSFKKGPQHMNGEQALIFVRSRHGSNGEGGDLARNRRQQIVLHAIRDRLMSRGVFTSPSKIAELWGVVSSHIQTDLSVWDMVKLAPLAARFDRNKIVSHILSADPGGELVITSMEGLGSMLFPRQPDWSEIRALAANPFETKEERAAAERVIGDVRVEIKNGTLRAGFAAQVAEALRQRGYTVTGTGNALQRGYEKTVIFDLTGGKKTTELAKLKSVLSANVSSVLPAWLNGSHAQRVVYSEGLTAEPVNASTTEFLVILGDSSLSFIDPYVSQAAP